MIWDQQPYYRPQQPEHFWYTTTTRVYGPQPSVGETWYVKLPGVVSLQEVVVKGVTAHTVELESQPHKTVTRYVKDEVTFIEKVYK